MILFFCSNVRAQTKKIKFHSFNSIGLVIGESRSDMMLQSVNGIFYSNLYSGIGFGIDDYNYNSYPVFFDQRIFFDKKRNAFIYGDIGYNFPAKNKPGEEIYYTSYHFRGGIYTDFGIGYKMKFIKKSSFLITAGYSYKKIYDKIGAPGPAGSIAYSTYSYGFGRIILKAGVDF